MSLFSARSISGRLTALVLIVSGTALFFAYISFLGYDFYTLRQNLVDSLETQASIVASNTEAALLFDDEPAATSTLSALRASPLITSAEIVRPDGKLFVRYSRPGTPVSLQTRRLEPGKTSGYWIEQNSVVLAHEITSSGKTIGFVYLTAETSDVSHRARQFGLIAAAILLLCFAVALLTTARLRGMLSRPLTNLADTARTVSRERNYSVRAEIPKRRDELALLVESFNEMLDEIEQSRSVLEKRVAERTAELTAANKELEAFSYTVAHDLRGPLQQVANIGYLLQDSKGVHTDPESNRLLDRMISAVSRMSSLIDDILSLSRATSAPMHCARVDLTEIAKTTLETLAQNDSRNVVTTVAAGCIVHADPGLMAVVMENLLRNAWKYSSQKDPAQIEFGCRPVNGKTVYFVKDDGAGFDPVHMNRLFQPFERLHSQAEFPGTGVGLATVQRIIRRHGGEIWASGRVGAGAEFCFTLGSDPSSSNSLLEK